MHWGSHGKQRDSDGGGRGEMCSALAGWLRGLLWIEAKEGVTDGSWGAGLNQEKEDCEARVPFPECIAHFGVPRGGEDRNTALWVANGYL